MGKPPIKSTKALVKAELEAKAKFELSKKGIELSLRKMLDRVDPIEMMAVISGTIVVYDIIKSTPEFLAGLAQLSWKALFEPFGWEKIIWDWLTNQTTVTFTDDQKKAFEEAKTEFDVSLLMKSFFISYILVKHSGQIIAGVGNVSGFIAGFLGLKMKV